MSAKGYQKQKEHDKPQRKYLKNISPKKTTFYKFKKKKGFRKMCIHVFINVKYKTTLKRKGKYKLDYCSGYFYEIVKIERPLLVYCLNFYSDHTL